MFLPNLQPMSNSRGKHTYSFLFTFSFFLFPQYFNNRNYIQNTGGALYTGNYNGLMVCFILVFCIQRALVKD